MADDVLVDFLGSEFPKRTDDTLRSIQAAVLAGTILLINLWADMLCSGSLDQEEPRIRQDQILMHFDPNLSSILRKLLQTKYKRTSLWETSSS